MSTIILICGAALIIYAIYGTVQKLRGKSKSSCCGSPEAVIVKKVADTDKSHYPFKYIISIDGMMCSNCAANVENAINAMDDTWACVELGRHRAVVLSKNEKTERDFAEALRKTSYSVIGFETAEV
jgi:copper chaperone CopZ